MRKKTVKGLKKRCWELFSQKRRLEESDKHGYCYCITCGKREYYKDMNAGHYCHGVLDFDFMNINPQCVRCNQHLSGNLGKYSLYLLKKYGLEEFENLHIRASMALKGEYYTVEGLELLLSELKKDVERLLRDIC